LPVALLRGSLRAALLIVFTAVMIPAGLLVQTVRVAVPDGMKRLYYRVACRVAGIRVEVSGNAVRDRAVLFVANHVSYIDIPAIGTQVDVNFVAKAEVAGWPVFGLLAKLAGTVFVSRDRRQVAAQHAELERRLAAGGALFLFPEGTSSDGRQVLPFNSSLMGIAGAGSTLVQPVTVAYLDPRADYAWYADMTLLPHLGRILGLPGVTLRLLFHPPVDGAGFALRKELARQTQAVVADGLQQVVEQLPPLPADAASAGTAVAADLGGG